ncbi:hypothetical protein [Pseudobacteriovorax antillogorgiicola]|uniref:Outer membrane protein beta-barrel domain-containing protein n=1 Tax=Pseudobacteriovorax antillogorgiicola TaxID=1513793 RepID=A0A1Y6CPZ7_9BACT|nr:hypothetical protein [Pseudobacteriovorax antillogorgiicola]TCS46365.1 hypothetical protein EDD56_12429 [Pseudobacteriovorax antillogorgiicola]SMF68470.1 hypothetical protein SAMN06296036_12429 [Pseudobacteriovorax antillogorgiicola]
MYKYLLLLTLLSTHSRASEINIVSGLSQPLVVNGGNLEINYLTENLIFEYSHGWSLDFAAHGGLAQTEAENDQNLELFLPYSTGGGIGYRLSKQFNARLEYKEHYYEVNRKNSDESFQYITRSLGIGLYWEWQPWQNMLLIVPSLRYWPNLNSSLAGDKFELADGEIHKAHDQGLFANVSIGCKF